MIESGSPPVAGRNKCNIDAASSLNRTGIDICVRDSNGTFVLAKIVSLPCFVPVDVGEAVGLHSALQWMSDMQFDNVDFEMDSKLTSDAFSFEQERHIRIWLHYFFLSFFVYCFIFQL